MKNLKSPKCTLSLTKHFTIIRKVYILKSTLNSVSFDTRNLEKQFLTPIYITARHDPRRFDLSSRGQLTKNPFSRYFPYFFIKSNKSPPYSCCASSNINSPNCTYVALSILKGTVTRKKVF
jgi:hypothetical protein